MSSPFPGMDPYLEAERFWPEFHQQLVQALYQHILSNLTERYRLKMHKRVYETEMALFTSVVREEHLEEFVEIRQRADQKPITFVEVVSPANKTTPAGRDAYLEQRRQGRSQGANFVEIDLVLQGEPTLDYDRANLPAWHYLVTVTRATQPEKHEIYTSTLQKRLPRFRLPLSSEERDAVIDLQLCFSRSYDLGDFLPRIAYDRTPPTKLTDDDLTWLHDWLVTQGLRK